MGRVCPWKGNYPDNCRLDLQQVPCPWPRLEVRPGVRQAELDQALDRAEPRSPVPTGPHTPGFHRAPQASERHVSRCSLWQLS